MHHRDIYSKDACDYSCQLCGPAWYPEEDSGSWLTGLSLSFLLSLMQSQKWLWTDATQPVRVTMGKAAGNCVKGASTGRTCERRAQGWWAGVAKLFGSITHTKIS